MTNEERALLEAEYGPLREEVNRTIDRMNSNEFASGAAVFALIAFPVSVEFNSLIPESIFTFFSVFVCFVIAFFGERRSTIFRRHMDQVEDYLVVLEKKFSDTGGWSNHYRLTMANRDSERQYGSRRIFWVLLQLIASENLGLHIGALFLIESDLGWEWLSAMMFLAGILVFLAIRAAIYFDNKTRYLSK